MSLLAAHGVWKSFGEGQDAASVLGGVDLAIAPGELVAIVGFSGSGKTTLLSILAGLLAPDRGHVELAGERDPKAGPRRGVVFQTYSLLPWLSVTENVALAVERVFPGLTPHERRDHVARYVAMVGLAHAAEKKPSELSGGMRQRASVARALAAEPQVLLLDEPFGALDALTRASLQDELARIHARTQGAVVLVTNDVDEALLLGDRIVPLSMGPAATLGASVRVDVPRPRRRAALASLPAFKRARGEVMEQLLRSRSKAVRALPRVCA